VELQLIPPERLVAERIEPKNLPPSADKIGRICGRRVEFLEVLRYSLDRLLSGIARSLAVGSAHCYGK
jgi:hypothetical protein